MKYLIYLLTLFLLQFGLGAFNSEYIFYFSSFQVATLIFINIFLKLGFKLNKYFFYFSYSAILFVISFFIEFSLIIYFFIFITPITIFLSNIFFHKKNHIYKLMIFFIIIIYSLLSIIIIHENLFYYNNYKNHYNKNVENIFYDENNKPFIFEKNKIYVLDFWTTSCSVCIEKFPYFNEISKKHSNDPKIKFYVVNVRLNKNDKDKVLKYTSKKYDYFQNLYINSRKEAINIDVNNYPTILIIKENKIIYNGYPSFNSYVLSNNLNTLINEIKSYNNYSLN